MKNTWSTETLSTLLKNGYEMDERGTLRKSWGSISNNEKIVIHAPQEMEDIAETGRYNVCWIEYEREEWPGYFEIDRKVRIERYIQEGDLVEWLKHPRI